MRLVGAAPPLLHRALSHTPPAWPVAAASAAYDDGAFAVAPMMDYTDQFLRFLLRSLSARATLYTEMVTANTLVHCDPSELPRFLGHAPADGATVLQVGGADPAKLRAAAAIAAPWGFSAINLNCGCPSDRVAGSGAFGAALMREPALVGDCCAALADGAGGALPITVKCRIGVTADKAEAARVDDEATYAELHRFVETVAARGGVRFFALHARKAVLGGLSPAQNRQVPPLRYALVSRLAADFPGLRFSLNGGVESLADAAAHLAPGSGLSGVMVGRAVVARPWEWATTDTALYGAEADVAPSRRAVLDAYAAFAAEQEAAIAQSIRQTLIKPAVNLFAGEPHGRQFRRAIDTLAKDRSVSAADVLRTAADEALLPATLDAPPGWAYDYDAKEYRPAADVAAAAAERRALAA